MGPLRRIILSLALMAGLVPAISFAQAPPPVPALPDTERRTSYSISGTTCACSIGFALYGDSTDYSNWLEVFINGVQITQAGNWTISSPTGSLATIPRPITDAVLTFTVAQTGTIQIVGARRPRRTSQFSENRGVAARDLNQALTDIIAQNRETWDKINDVTGRVPRAPPGETLNMLPVLTSRQNTGACFDSGGNLTSCITVPAGTISAGTGILFTGTNPTTITNNIQAGAGVKFTGTNPIILSAGGSNSNYVQLSDFGITCDGSTDWATQLQTMITASAGKTIYIPPGPDCLTSASLTLPSNTTIIGGGREVSTVRGTGAAGNTTAVFIAAAATNISLKDFWCKGTDQVVSWSSSSFGCFRFTGNGGTYNIQNMKVSNFNVSYWMRIDAGAAILPQITFSNNWIVSASGDIPTDGSNVNNTNYGFLISGGSAGAGRIENTLIQNNRIEATGLCFPIVVFNNTYKTQVSNNLIVNAGVTTPNHCLDGAQTTFISYGILIYDNNGDGNPPTNFEVTNNTIISPYSTGIYIVGDGNPAHTTSVFNSSGSVISGNLIDNQVAQTDATLPRGGIVVNLLTDVDIIGNKIRNSFGGIVAAAQMTGVVNIVGNSCTTNAVVGASTPSCYKLTSGSNGSSNTDRRILKANYGESTNGAAGNVLIATSLTGARFNDIEISDNTFNAGWNGLNLQNLFATGSVLVNGNKFGGVAANFMASVSSNTGSPIGITNNIFDSIAGVAGNGLTAASSTIHMANNKFINRTSGTVPLFTAIGACGTIIGTQFNNVLNGLAMVAATSLGTSNPSGCTLNYMDQVQNLAPSELNTGGFGTSGQKYVVDHWSHISTTASTTHLEQRILTGN